MKNIDVVIGMNYGDEGKGHLTDYLVNKSNTKSAVVRFNGGAQAGHTVEANNERHVFHHLASGTLAGAATILSRFFVVNPVLFFKERTSKTLIDRDIKVYVDPRCYVSTPYDVILNRVREASRNGVHGSCGIGFGETIQREELGFTLCVSDLRNRTSLHDRMRKIRDEYFYPEMEKLGAELSPSLDLNEAEERFVVDSLDFIKAVTIVEDTFVIDYFDHIVFEGAQGLRLDQYSQDFPHVTRSSTGLENVSVLLEDVEANINVHYLTRSYLTRHGAGPLDMEMDNPGIVDETNIHNDYQGTLRFAFHDINRMRADVDRDKEFLKNNNVTYTAVITCCDQYKLFFNDTNIYEDIMTVVGTDQLLTSWGPTRDDFR